MKNREMLLYRNVPEEDLMEDFCRLAESDEPEGREREELSCLYHSCASRLISLAGHYGFEGNLWHCYLALVLAYHENPFSTSCEITGPQEGSLNDWACHDFRIFMELFAFDLPEIDRRLGVSLSGMIKGYRNPGGNGREFNSRIRERLCTLAVHLAGAETLEGFYLEATQFYREFGVGKLGLHKAFRVEHEGQYAKIVPITKIEHVSLDQLVGYDAQKKKLIANTESFVSGQPANNVLLFGDSGTGKSTSIKGILNAYYDRGLRMIEIYKHQFQDLNDVIAQIKNRNYKFIIYMDDLSFEEFEIEYKYLKAVIEGGLEKKPENVLIYATSNRRHLIRESFNDKPTLDDLHNTDTVQEKLSLVARFGVTIYFGRPDKKEFQRIVKGIAKAAGLEMPEEELFAEANKWELSHGGMSGRTAQQFITYLQGR